MEIEMVEDGENDLVEDIVGVMATVAPEATIITVGPATATSLVVDGITRLQWWEVRSVGGYGDNSPARNRR